ncbi:hypothetical protein PF006_g18404 [Phytophthora fragariae]|uniref:Uncharacterized protein n=1 Tax=Phytophthora fragariae TaxID=53985 RepID=A0A6A3JFJ9_9STRA|nr:hypothetical protein PF011_g18393 [Phytophthora fragariae]KAE9119214.1 hypothetical protein PF006_g18404 [Phytophthora fragariae]
MTPAQRVTQRATEGLRRATADVYEQQQQKSQHSKNVKGDALGTSPRNITPFTSPGNQKKPQVVAFDNAAASLSDEQDETEEGAAALCSPLVLRSDP